MTETRPPPAAEASASFELMAADDESRYLLRSRSDILFVLRSMLRSRDLIAVHVEGSPEFLLSALLAVEDAGLVFDCGADAAMNRRALAAERLILTAAHDKVRIQFVLPWLRHTLHHGQPALAAPVPESLLRLQRREYYRLVAPVAQPLRCTLALLGPGGERQTIDAQIIDISGGGIAVMGSLAGTEFVPEQEFESCRLELPDIGRIDAGLRVRNVFQITLRSGARVKRYGCQFLRMPHAMQSMIERYIMKVERDRKARGAA
jgi:c-di-GMP-binding flagellar brake protein YcgR